MQGLKEILLSFTIGLVSLSAIHFSKRVAQAGRAQGNAQPTQITLSENEIELQRPAWPRQNQKERSFTQERVVVAIIDTGADVFHPALKDSVWRNPGEEGLDKNGLSKATNGVDDDDNGFVDDIHGWNFVEHSPDVTDDHGHGTHIAGIIGAKDGVAPDVSLMILKYYDTKSEGPENLSNTIKAIRYAVRMKAKVINYSGGGILKSQEEEAALAWAEQEGVIVVAAAGNEGVNSDFFHFYPADYDLPNIVSVAAADRKGALIPMSNYGLETVDVAAPGKNIYSTLPNGQYGYMTGTSQATAFVSGAAALLVASGLEHPEEIRAQIMKSGERLTTLRNKIQSEAMVNVDRALLVVQTPARRQPARNTN